MTVGFESITVKRDLGASLKAARSAAKLSTTSAAAKVGISQASVSRIENGRQTVSEDQLRQMAQVYRVTSAELSRWFGMLIRVNAPDQWWHEVPYKRWLTKQHAELIGVESAAVAVMSNYVKLIPGLLQTAAYTRALLEGSPLDLDPGQVEVLTEIRQIRQQRLSLDSPRPLAGVFTISQAALELCYSSEEVHREQMLHLLRLSEQENISISVVPFGRMFDMDPADLYELPGGANPVVFTESLMASTMVHTIDEVDRVRNMMLMAQHRALSPAETIEAIRQRMDGSRYARK